MLVARTETRLEVWRTVAEAYALTFGNLGYLLRISWAWVVLMMPVSLAFYASAFWFGRHNSAGEGYLASLFEDLLSTLLFLPFLASIAVAWHRLLLMNEEWPGSVYLRLDGCVASYLGLSAVISILFPGTMSVFISGVAAGWHGLLLLGVALATAVGLFLSTRIWLALPARAL